MIKLFIRQILKKSGRKNILGPSGPSDKWIRKFLKRNPQLHMRKPQTIDGGRARMANGNVMQQHFALLKQTVHQLGLENKPHLIYNMDETGFGKGAIAQDKVCVTSGGAYTKQVATTNHSTATVCVSADGKVLPSFIVFEKSFPGGSYRDGIPQEWLFGTSPNGYMDAELFEKWFEQIFLKFASKERPLLLLMDNHESHLSLGVIEKARANRVDLLCLPPHTTHILQPLDVALFRPLKKEFSNLAVSLGYANPHLMIGNGRFSQVLHSAMDRVFSPFNIKTAFRKCGIVPLDPNAIDKSRLTASDVDFTLPTPGPGGDNSENHMHDPLCQTCGQFVMGHPLVKQGIIPAELADIFVPVIGSGPVNKQKNTRIVTQSRVITGSEIYSQLKEKEKQKNKQTNKQTSKKRPQEQTLDTDLDNLPKLQRPKKRKPKSCTKTVENNHELAAEEFTCPLCNIRGHVDDEEHGILWVGCDSVDCGRWFHRDCLKHEEQTNVDLSLLVASDWLCQFCSTDEIVQTPCDADASNVIDMESIVQELQNATSGDQAMLICQVCMAHEYVSPNERDVYWALCDFCDKSFHAICLPQRVYRSFELRKASENLPWCCKMCPSAN
ncbi:uncharacterized protein [Argopecten irradians]|uniref:uncharacterized protein n=1 Tax=Argopecten irradians TaxID=31199 RepID=UPI003719E265